MRIHKTTFILTLASHAAAASAHTSSILLSIPSAPHVISVAPLGPMRQNASITARDGTFSLALGRVSAWVFNDTILSRPNATGANFIDNSIGFVAVPRSFDVSTDYADQNGLPARFTPFSTDEAAFQAAHAAVSCQQWPCGQILSLWPGQPIVDTANSRVIMPIYSLTRSPGVPGWSDYSGGFAISPLATFPAGLTRPVVDAIPGKPTALWNAGQRMYLDQPVIIGNMLYAFGSSANGQTYETDDRLARVPLSQISNLSAWTYYAGNNGWSSDPAAAAVVFQGGDAGTNVFFNGYFHEWMATYEPPWDNAVYMRVASNLWGPWSAPTLLFEGAPSVAGAVNYGGRAHPELNQNGATSQAIYLTYSQVTGPFTEAVQVEKVILGR